MTVDLPCPCCGSVETLAKLRYKRDLLKARLQEERRNRYPVAVKNPMPGGGAISIIGGAGSVVGVAGGSSLYDHFSDYHCRGLTIAAPQYSNEAEGTMIVNGAVLDVCLECGTFYARNAASLREKLETEIAEMDPLGALAEIRQSESADAG